MIATKQEGVAAWLFHGPKVSLDDGKRTYSKELWQRADERHEMNADFWKKVARLGSN